MPEPTGGSTRAKQGPTATHCPDAYWAGHAYSTHVGTPVSVRRCYLCGYIDWADLAEQVATLTADLTRERDEARTERDQLAAAVNRASSVRVDTRDVIWHPADAGRWQHPLYGVLDLDQIEAEYGRTRPALLVPIDDDAQADEQRAGQVSGDAIAAAARELGAIDGRRAVAGELDRLAANPALTTAWLERHSVGGQVTLSPPDILRAVVADIQRGEVHGRRERWVVDGLVGSWVCAEPAPDMPDGICGMPVEDVPCTVHHPADGATP